MAASWQGIAPVEALDIAAYPPSAATSLHPVAEARVPLEDVPEARIIAFRAADGGIEHLAILVGDPVAFAAAGGTPLAARTANASPVTFWVRCAAIAGRSCVVR